MLPLLVFAEEHFLLVCLVANEYVDIMYLNKQRIMALEELNKAKKEIETLHQRIESLEAGKHETTRRGDFVVSLKLMEK